MNEINSFETFSRILLLVAAFILAAIFSGLHTFACLCLGFLWPYCLLYDNGARKNYVIWGRWKIGHGRYSFINLIKNLDRRLAGHFNPRQSPYIASFLRTLPPSILFIALDGLFAFNLEWYFILFGALVFEWAYAHGKRKILWAFLRNFF